MLLLPFLYWHGVRALVGGWVCYSHESEYLATGHMFMLMWAMIIINMHAGSLLAYESRFIIEYGIGINKNSYW